MIEDLTACLMQLCDMPVIGLMASVNSSDQQMLISSQQLQCSTVQAALQQWVWPVLQHVVWSSVRVGQH